MKPLTDTHAEVLSGVVVGLIMLVLITSFLFGLDHQAAQSLQQIG